MMYFARVLRSFESPSVYRIFTDRRWDSLIATFLAKREHNVSFTATVKPTSKYHVVKHWITRRPNNRPPIIIKSKARNRRGKYRSATTCIDGVRLNTCMWNDSALVGGISADLGCENEPVARRTGRHIPPVACPRMMNVRGKFLRGVDIHDQLRASKYRFVFICKKKAWPVLAFGLTEILIVNIYIIKRTANARIDPGQYRWDLVFGLVMKAKDLESRNTAVDDESGSRRSIRQRGGETASSASASASDTPAEVVPRFEGAGVHHHDRLCEYVTPEQAEINQRIVDADKGTRDYNRQPRQRDRNRKHLKVRNPLFTSASLCLVCKYQHGKRKETLKYCRECSVQNFTNWPRTNRATGFATQFHPRLCSKECFDYFHTHNIRGLDYAHKKRKRRSNSSQNTNSDSNRNSNSSSQVEVDTQNTSDSISPSVTNQTSRSRNNRYDV